MLTKLSCWKHGYEVPGLVPRLCAMQTYTAHGTDGNSPMVKILIELRLSSGIGLAPKT